MSFSEEPEVDQFDGEGEDDQELEQSAWKIAISGCHGLLLDLESINGSLFFAGELTRPESHPDGRKKQDLFCNYTGSKKYRNPFIHSIGQILRNKTKEGSARLEDIVSSIKIIRSKASAQHPMEKPTRYDRELENGITKKWDLIVEKFTEMGNPFILMSYSYSEDKENWVLKCVAPGWDKWKNSTIFSVISVLVFLGTEDTETLETFEKRLSELSMTESIPLWDKLTSAFTQSIVVDGFDEDDFIEELAY